MRRRKEKNVFRTLELVPWVPWIRHVGLLTTSQPKVGKSFLLCRHRPVFAFGKGIPKIHCFVLWQPIKTRSLVWFSIKCLNILFMSGAYYPNRLLFMYITHWKLNKGRVSIGLWNLVDTEVHPKLVLTSPILCINSLIENQTKDAFWLAFGVAWIRTS